MVGIVIEKLIIYAPLIVICLLVLFLLYLVGFTTYRGYKAIQKGEWLKAIDYFVATALEVLFLYFMYTFIINTINPNFRWLASLVVFSIMLSKTIFTLIILHINHRKIKETEAEKTENDAEIKAKPVKQNLMQRLKQKSVKEPNPEIKAESVKEPDAEIKAEPVKEPDPEIKAEPVAAEKKKSFWKYWIWMGLGFIALVVVMIPILYYWFEMNEYLEESQHFKYYFIKPKIVSESKELKEIIKYMNKSSFVLGIVSSLVGVSVISKGIVIYLRGKNKR